MDYQNTTSFDHSISLSKFSLFTTNYDQVNLVWYLRITLKIYSMHINT